LLVRVDDAHAGCIVPRDEALIRGAA
jgi:hypothetical protein